MRSAENGDDLALALEARSTFDFEIDRVAAESFWPFVMKGPGCWIWMRSLRGDGYGQFWFRRRLMFAHRFAFLFANDFLTDGLTIDHLCGVKACVRPSHLEEVHALENALRGAGPHFGVATRIAA